MATATVTQQSSPTAQALSGAQTVTMTQTSDQTVSSAYRYMIAWLVIFVILFLLNRSRLGHAAIYYTLVLALVLLFITQAGAISSLVGPLQPGGSSSGSSNGGAASGGGGTAGGF